MGPAVPAADFFGAFEGAFFAADVTLFAVAIGFPFGSSVVEGRKAAELFGDCR
jgi:hypothetical protein